MKKRIFSLLLAAMMLMSLLAGTAFAEKKTYCGNDVSKEVKLTAYVLGDKPIDADMVYEEINKILKETINATIEWKYLSWSEHGTKYPLLFTSQEDFDLIFTAPAWAHYEEIVGMGGFEPITTEWLEKCAPNLLKIIPEAAWAQTMVDGVSYCVPAAEAKLRSEVNAIRGDLLEAAGMTDITSYEELKQFCTWVAEHQDETGVSPYGASTGGLMYQYEEDNGLGLLLGLNYNLMYYNKLEPDNYEVEYLLDQPWFTQYCYDMKELYEAGWWSKDSLASQSTFQENFLQGKAATFRWNVGSVTTFLREAEVVHPEWKVTFVDHQPDAYKQVEPYNNNDMAINTFSSKKDRALMALDVLYSNKEANQLLRYGVEGVHYTLVDEVYFTRTEDNGKYSTNCPAWAIKNPEFALTEYNPNPTEYEIKEAELRKTWKALPHHDLTLFTFDTSNVTTQVSMIHALQAQYFTPLVSGMVDDVDAAIAELRAQLEMAGIQDVLAEAQRQANERKGE